MLSKINILSSFFIAFFLISCSTVGSYNQPFVNTDETLKIKEGMTKELVLMNVGEPYFVESGKNNTEIWVYNVRTITVMSDLKTMQPNKKHPEIKHAGMHHKLQITFKSGKVISWGPFEQKKDNKKNNKVEDKTDNKEEQSGQKMIAQGKEASSLKTTSDKKTNNFILEIKPGLLIHEDFTAMSAGARVGYKSFALDFTGGINEDEEYGVAIMLIYNKKMNKITLEGGLGVAFTEWRRSFNDNYYDDWYDYDYWWGNYGWTDKQSVALKLSAGYELKFGKFSITPTYEMNLAILSDEEGAGFSNLAVNIGFR
tara:strand:- start:169 stop:1104 length:936 start_codon:yes stop_codon:yes gene_type:complete